MTIKKKFYKIKDARNHDKIIGERKTYASALRLMHKSIYYWIDEDYLLKEC